MAYDDLGSFLSTLDEQGQLVRITDEVTPEPDIAAAATPHPGWAITHRHCTSTASRASPALVSR